MRKRLIAMILCASIFAPYIAYAEVSDYEAVRDTYIQEDKTPQSFQIDDGAGNTVNAIDSSYTFRDNLSFSKATKILSK